MNIAINDLSIFLSYINQDNNNDKYSKDDNTILRWYDIFRNAKGLEYILLNNHIVTVLYNG